MYGHLDKQPPLTEEWETGLHPYNPVVRDGKIYGRGSSDDGYAIFSAVTAVKALQAQGNVIHNHDINSSKDFLTQRFQLLLNLVKKVIVSISSTT